MAHSEAQAPAPLAESPGLLAQLASILEAAARKPGNVHPERAFADLEFMDFLLSAAAIAPVFEEARARPVGETVLAAVRATRQLVGKNTNLGIILLLAPLAKLPAPVLSSGAPSRPALQEALAAILQGLTRDDAALGYEAIRLAAPGGLGAAEVGDVRGAPAGTLLEMMALARERDSIARQYAGGYQDVLATGLPALERALAAGRSLEEAIIVCHLEFLAQPGDSLIARKCGEAVAREASRRARAVLAAGWPDGPGAAPELAALDGWLRADGHRRNPGAAADLVAAVLFLALGGGIISLPLSLGTKAHGKV